MCIRDRNKGSGGGGRKLAVISYFFEGLVLNLNLLKKKIKNKILSEVGW
jgi:hypothetical protein